MTHVLVQEVHKAFASRRTLALSFRRRQLKNLLKMYDECGGDILHALQLDLRKAKLEGTVCELDLLKADVRLNLKNLKKWTSSDKLPFNLPNFTDHSYVHREPYGVVLILGAWNYPFGLTLGPLAGAIAAGNCVVIKPSEMSPNSAKVVATLVPRYLDQECYKIFEGDAEHTVDLLTHKFDYIFFTGSTVVGKSVMMAAAKYLTPVTLELGGKSPAYVDDQIDINLAAKRILWGKCMNLGQTCVAPDYVLISKKREQEFLQASAKILEKWFPQGVQQSKDLSRIINERHFNRLQKILDTTQGRVVIGGQSDAKDLFIHPTIIVDVDAETDSTMREEIFGPILSIINVESLEAAIHFICQRPKPLASYVFSKNQKLVNKFVNETSSGTICVNDVMVQYGSEGLPFGGVGDSGMGNYHGKYSVETFSHKKAVQHRGVSWASEKIFDWRYSPYVDENIKYVSWGIRSLNSFNVTCNPVVSHATVLLTGMACGILVTWTYFRWR